MTKNTTKFEYLLDPINNVKIDIGELNLYYDETSDTNALGVLVINLLQRVKQLEPEVPTVTVRGLSL